MSRKRYISTSISLDKVVNQIAMEHGDFAALFYTWSIPQAEDDATLRGDPEELLWTIMPGRRDKTADDVASALRALHDAELIAWDEEADVVYFDTSTFYNYQTYIGKEKRADNSEVFAALHPYGDSADNQRRTPENSGERRTSPENPVSPSPSLSPSPIEKTLHKCSAAVGDDSAAADSDDLTCSLRDLPDTIRDDEELWSLLQSVLGRSAGALFNAKAKSGHAVTLRRMIGDLCAFTGNAMAGVPCERRRPACRACLVHVLQTIAAADEPVKLAQHLLDSAEELADYVPEAMVEMCRMVEKGAPPSEFAKMLGRSMSADLSSTEVDDD